MNWNNVAGYYNFLQTDEVARNLFGLAQTETTSNFGWNGLKNAIIKYNKSSLLP